LHTEKQQPVPAAKKGRMRPTSAHPAGRAKGGHTTDEEYQTSNIVVSGSEAYETDHHSPNKVAGKIGDGIEVISDYEDDDDDFQENEEMLDKLG
jgi:hypothetical protein